jgi:hypothetical protein
MTKYRSPFSVDYQTPVFIASNDPRNKNEGNLEKYRARIGRDVEIVNMGQPLVLEEYVPTVTYQVDRQFFMNIIYANDRFVTTPAEIIDVFGSDELAFNASSSDGITWELSYIPFSYAITPSLIFNGTKFIASTYNTSQIPSGPYPVSLFEESTDGLTWTYSSDLGTGPVELYFGNGNYIRYYFDVDFNIIREYSTDLINWTAFASDVYIIGFANGKFIGTDLVSLCYSSNGYTWSYGSTVPLSSASTLSYGSSKYVLATFSSMGNITYSSDGISWTNISIDMKPLGITHGDGKFIAVGDSDSFGSKAMYSTDGISWSTITDTTLNDVAQYMQFGSIAYGGGKFVITGYGYADSESPAGSRNIVLYSTNGVTWTRANMPDTVMV